MHSFSIGEFYFLSIRSSSVETNECDHGIYSIGGKEKALNGVAATAIVYYLSRSSAGIKTSYSIGRCKGLWCQIWGRFTLRKDFLYLISSIIPTPHLLIWQSPIISTTSNYRRDVGIRIYHSYFMRDYLKTSQGMAYAQLLPAFI
ncbi:hypothetical protein COLO4_04104 [Corchorus olitorius]|uniref:Uncharacterized protein n=1 Tax=Corchorus olitorius TaxID=93759 RepID=A0A1R3KV99_9ROSI|nr:hypothetical protein COLO4_04104 [Corchorus olitorius]